MSAGSSARIRRLAPADAGAYRELRLAALANHPQAFGSSHEDEVRFDDDRWYQRLSGGADLATFGAAVDGQLVGTATCVRESHRKERHRACLVGMYVTPAARGRGIGAQLVTAVISHARDHGVDQLELDVVQGNASAIALYERAGFRAWGTRPDALRVEGRSWDEIAMALRLD